MKSTTIPTPIIIFGMILLVISSFTLGAIVYPKSKSTVQAGNPVSFIPTKSDKPQLDFYVMSFCPYGNLAESTLKPVFELFKDKVSLNPHYIFDKIPGNISTYCQSRVGDPANCPTYVKNSNGQIKNEAECRKLISEAVGKCTNEKNYLKIGDNYYSSLHGRSEAIQNIREICSWRQSENKTNWWNFVSLVNQNCTVENVDTCWEGQAKNAGLDITAITDCFNKDAQKIMDEELALTTKNSISSSPTTLINTSQFPPEAAYQQGNYLKIAKTSFTSEQVRTPEAIKTALCAAFGKTPKECKTKLSDTANPSAPAAGGCGN